MKVGKTKKPRSNLKNLRAKIHTAKNKIRRIQKALKYAGGGEVQRLKDRLEFWHKQL